MPPGRRTGTSRGCWTDCRPRQERPDRYCAAHNAGSDPTKTCGFLAQWVFLRHTHRAGSLPADSSFQEGVRALAGREAGVAGRAIRRPGSASERAPLIG